MTPKARLVAFHAVMWAIPLLVAAAALGVYGYVVAGRFADVPVRYEGDPDIVFDGGIGFVRAPEASTRRRQPGLDYTIHTDALGARVDAAGDRTPARVDILTVGCSFSEGHGLRNEQTYTSRLGRLLDARVANFAVGSYGGVQSALQLERHAGLAPKVIVYGLIEDHLRRNLDPCAPNFFPTCLRVPTVAGLDAGRPHFTPVPGSGLAGVDLTAELLALHDRPGVLARARAGLRATWHEYRDWRAPDVVAALAEAGDANRVPAELYVVRRMADVARRLGATLVVLHIGRLDGRPADDTSRGWRPLPPELVAALPPDVVFVDAVPAVAAFQRAHPDQPLVLSRTDEHPNARAHRLFAGLVAEAIRRRKLLPAADDLRE